jgi:hypothetical protein
LDEQWSGEIPCNPLFFQCEGVPSKGAVYAKLDDLGLEVEATMPSAAVSTTSCLQLPQELLTVGEVLKK